MPDRFLNITGGVAMVVTDLHGDRDAFNRYVTRFRHLYAEDKAQRLIFLGDIIHGYGSDRVDGSLPMILGVMALQEEFGPDTVIMLLGNHEMPHIYGVSLAKGDMEYTPRFEHLLSDHRAAVLTFLKSLPFFARTAAGVLLTHSGPSAAATEHVMTLRHFDHQTLLDQADAMLAEADDLEPLYRQYSQLYGAPYDQEVEYYLAVKDKDDPRYPHLLRAFSISQQSQEFQILWDALFSMCEAGLTEYVYLQMCQQFLKAFSVDADAPAPQRVILSGHIVTPMGGHTIVNRCHFRLSSATHARPREAGEYLMLDCARPVNAATQLMGGLSSVFAEDDQDV